jgi:hypothetical protein
LSDLHALSSLSIPADILTALDYRPFRFAMQPVHHLVRMAHIVSMSGFFGAICLLDLRLADFRTMVSLRALSIAIMPWIYATFAVAMISGLLLFFYDPVHVASHAYFSLKMILIGLGMVNSALFGRWGFGDAMHATGPMPVRARIAGSLSLAIWCGVMICACLNSEAAPKVLLR